MHETITLQIGQCGNQVGNEFWKRISAEHGIALSDSGPSSYRGKCERFFYTTDSGQHIPRAILVDSEPRVIGQCDQIFNTDSVFVSAEGGGAGNNWAQGYYIANKSKEDFLEIVQREAEACDGLESFNLLHSIAGGTGSGFGSLVLTELRDAFPKSIITSFAIFPNADESSEVVVQPYNAVLSLNFMAQHCSSIVPMDNHALGKIAVDAARVKNVGYDLINSLVSTVISTATSTVRFPGYIYSDAHSLLSCTTPLHGFPFLVPSYTPFSSEMLPKLVRKTTVSDVMRRLLLPQTRLCTYGSSKAHADIARFNILEAVEDPSEVSRTLSILQNKRIANPVSWMPPFVQTAVSKRAPEFDRVSGLSLGNTTGIAVLLSNIGFQFDKIKKQNAFIEIYRKFDVDAEVFERCRKNLQGTIESYEMCEIRSPIAKI